VQLKLPEDMSTAEGLAHALAAILSSAAQGQITIGDAVQLASLLEIQRKMIETQEFERRLGEMENRMNLGKSASRTGG
jgi:primosomal protein N''